MRGRGKPLRLRRFRVGGDSVGRCSSTPTCSECGSRLVWARLCDGFELVCSYCGLVHDEFSLDGGGM